MTVERVKECGIPLSSIHIITSADYFHDVANDLRELPEENILVEPERRNTAPAIAFAMKALCSDEDETLLVLPADHMISPVEKFMAYVKEADSIARKGNIVTFGLPPNRPETGFGYIHAHGQDVLSFVEKPNFETACCYIQEGNYFWNSGIFAFTFRTMKEEMEKYAPDVLTDSPPVISIDYAVMEKSKRVKMIAMHLTWSDVGSWDNVYEMMQKDHDQNVTSGKVEMHETKNSLVLAEDRLVTVVGVDNLLIIETKDAVLITKREESQKVKDLVEKLAEKGSHEIKTHLTTYRPWGFYTVLEEEGRYKIKRIHVKPLAKLSLQLHYHRSEHWIIVSGTAKVTINEKEQLVHEGESIFVPKSSIHRVENPGKVALEIIEVQVGEYLGEDDIVRLEDIYGRLKNEAAFAVLQKSVC